ncbi:MAG: hypothetical protein QXV93_05020 [Zestosphaera sp.]
MNSVLCSVSGALPYTVRDLVAIVSVLSRMSCASTRSALNTLLCL